MISPVCYRRFYKCTSSLGTPTLLVMKFNADFVFDHREFTDSHVLASWNFFVPMILLNDFLQDAKRVNCYMHVVNLIEFRMRSITERRREWILSITVLSWSTPTENSACLFKYYNNII